MNEKNSVYRTFKLEPFIREGDGSDRKKMVLRGYPVVSSSWGPFFTNYCLNGALSYRTTYGTGEIYQNRKGMKINMLKNVSHTAYSWDNRIEKINGLNTYVEATTISQVSLYYPVGGANYVEYRHNQKANTLFADGHCQSLRYRDAMDVAHQTSAVQHLDGRGSDKWLY